MKYKGMAVLIFDILIICWDIHQYRTVLKPLFERVKYNDVEVVSDIVLPEPIDLGIQFEYCVLPTENIDLVAQFVAGTPIPYESVPVSTEAVIEQPTVDIELEPVQISAPTSIPTSTPTGSQFLNLKVVNVGKYSENNLHIVFVGVGNIENIGVEMQKVIDNFNESFAGINVDFAYVDSLLDLDFKHIQQLVNFENESDQESLFKAIKKTYPIDGLVVAIDTPLFLGTSHGNAAMLTLKDPNTIIIATHEVGHQLGLDDGYQFPYDDGYLANTELFYIDEMPSRLVRALNKLDEVAAVYKVGTCNGRDVYSFYESNNNIMRDYAPSETKTWGTSTFTPLQIILMNDYIAWHNVVYK